MSTLTRRIIICTLGVLAGIAAWPLIETLLAYQLFFPSYLLFSIATGAVFGLVLGAFFGSGEGIIVSVPGRILKGALTGALTGLAGGVVGFLVGQAVLFLMGNYVFRSAGDINTFALTIARSVGWAVLGLFVGMSEGIRARSGKKLLVGVLGGLIGGFLGGAILEYARLLFPTIGFARLIGLSFFGLLIGLFYGIIERKLSYGVLRLLTGRMKGKEYILGQQKMRIGVSQRNEIAIPGYREVEDLQAVLRIKGEDVILERTETGAPVYVNDQPIERHVLKYEDVIKIGSAKFFYRYE